MNGAKGQEAAVEVEQAGGDDDAESRSIYVKNLAWATEDKALAKHFDDTVSAAGGSIRCSSPPSIGCQNVMSSGEWAGHGFFLQFEE